MIKRDALFDQLWSQLEDQAASRDAVVDQRQLDLADEGPRQHGPAGAQGDRVVNEQVFSDDAIEDEKAGHAPASPADAPAAPLDAPAGPADASARPIP